MNKRIFTVSLVLVGLVLAVQGLAGDIKFMAIKPTATQNLTDEQQSILAVRNTKASVVNIIGIPKQLLDPNSSISLGTANQISGTGFIIDPDGMIVTNNHVVADINYNYFVVFIDGTQYPAQILGQDKYDDVALLKIKATGLPAVKIGNSDNLETGQTVFAIGNSLGKYQNTVTRGVISGLGRGVNENGDDSGSPTMHNWIQTDAAINLGNSGGPLINMSGEVVGMSTLIDAEGSSLGFAVPINAIKDSIDQLKTFGKVSRPFLGVQFTTINALLLSQKKLSVSDGALILAVGAGTPALNAGIKTDDVVVAVNGEPINKNNQLDAVVQKYQAGSQVVFKVVRGDQKLDLLVILGQLP